MAPLRLLAQGEQVEGVRDVFVEGAHEAIALHHKRLLGPLAMRVCAQAERVLEALSDLGDEIEHPDSNLGREPDQTKQQTHCKATESILNPADVRRVDEPRRGVVHAVEQRRHSSSEPLAWIGQQLGRVYFLRMLTHVILIERDERQSPTDHGGDVGDDEEEQVENALRTLHQAGLQHTKGIAPSVAGPRDDWVHEDALHYVP
eukprot:2445163-Prymnesium_polylepis.2